METTGGGTRNASAHVEKVPEQNALHSLAKGWLGWEVDGSFGPGPGL